MTPRYVMVYQSKHILKHNHYGITLDDKIKKKKLSEMYCIIFLRIKMKEKKGLLWNFM